MARVKNTTFTGVSLYRADVDAPTFTTALKEICADAALIYDKLTGRNGETNTIDHSGIIDQRGAPLGIPWCNQFMHNSLRLTTSTGTGGGKSGGQGQTALVCLPFFFPDGEGALDWNINIELDVTVGGPYGIREQVLGYQIMDTTGAIAYEGPMDFELGDPMAADMSQETRRFVARPRGIYSPSNQPLFLFITTNTDSMPTDAVASSYDEEFLLGLRVYSPRIRSGTGSGGVLRKETDDIDVTTPSSTQEMAWRDMYDGFFGTGYAYNAYLTAGLNRNLNGLMEFLTGWPAGDDASYTHEDHDGAGAADDVNPARSRFHAGTRSLAGMSAEPLPQFPLLSESFGGVMLDGYCVVNAYSSGTQSGMVDLQPIIPNRKTKTTVHRTFTSWPDFPTGASSNLKWVVLASFVLDPGNASGNGPSQWTAYVGTGSATGNATFTRIGSTSFAYASGSALDFPADQQGTVTLEIEKSGAGAKSTYDEIQLLGWSLYFEP